MIEPIFLDGSECRTKRIRDEKIIVLVDMSWLLRVAGIFRLEKIRNDDIRQSLGKAAKQLC